MHNKSKKIKILLMMIVMAIILSISSTVFGFSFPASLSHPYLYDNYLFCRNHNKSYSIQNVPGLIKSTRYIEYGEAGEIELEQSLAFAVYTASKMGNWNPDKIQEILWSTRQFKDLSSYIEMLDDYTGNTTSWASSDVLEARSNQYAQFYYGILNGGKNMEFTTETKDSKVLVDQTDKTYTVGPYKIDVKTGNLTDSVKNAKTILYNELAGINEQEYPNAPAFATYEITGLEGKNIKFLDKSGKEIKFPNWGEDFYIRYNPTNGVTTINPKIVINYIKKVTGRAVLYESMKATFSGEIRGIYVERDNFDPADFVRTGTLRQGGNAGASVEVRVTSYQITETETVDEDPEYDEYGNFIRYRTHRTYVKGFNYEAQIIDNGRIQKTLKITSLYENGQDSGLLCKAEMGKDEIDLGTKEISMELGGNVWVDLPGVKIGDFTGIKSEEDSIFAGMEVSLYDENNNLIATTVTNNEGKYHFYKLDPLKKYYVKFTYNGQIYQSTYYKNNLTGGYSNAMDVERESFNNRFGNIDSSPKNYKVGNEWHKSYAFYSKLARDNGEYISYGDGALKYENAWNKFLELSASKGSYEAAYNELSNWLASLGVGSRDRAGVVTFIKDCMITSTTLVKDPLSGKNVKYPVYDKFVLEDIKNPPEEVEKVTLDRTYSYLYTKKSDQSRYVDYGINRREQEELYIQKDVYKATVIVNGKKQDYMYSKKNLNDDGSWSVEVRAADELYNGAYSYSREIRKSEYLYDGSDAGTSDSKNLQVFVTYRLAVKNRSQSLYARINEIVDYYDADQYTFDGTLGADGTYSIKSYNEYDENGNVTGTYVNSYLGSNSKGAKQGDITVKNGTTFADRESSKVLTNGNYTYNSIYVTGLKSASGNDRLAPGEFAYVYLTFKANVDEATGKVKLDQDLNTGNTTIGKRNIAEINGYSTYYSKNATVPNYLNSDNSKVDTSVGEKVAGIIDTESNCGSLEEIDLNNDGDLRSSTDSEVENRLEMDTDKAPNIKLIINQNDDDTRRMTGMVYEDERTETIDKAVVGNGLYNDSETKINGVKVELVELVQNVDENGIFIGSYNGEKVWGTNIYELQDGILVKSSENNDRYYSGYGLSKVIIKGPGILDVKEDDIGKSNGLYSFKSVPAGDFFIRFTYGDNIQTVLVSGENEVNTLIGQKGLNEKSYNGQDYKTTSYQAGIEQNTSYNGIKGYTDYEKQNYNNATDKSAMYYYGIDLSNKVQGASDGKDVYSIRDKVNTWSKGADGQNLLNNRAETLASFERIGTYKYDNQESQKQAQVEMINNLIQNTAMIAQSGVINTEVEYNRKTTENQGDVNKLSYTIKDIDLGLQERPKAQVKLNKEITNIKLVLANGKSVFDTTQSVSNLYYAKHEGHSGKYEGFRLVGYKLGKNSKETPELIQAYLDEELMAGAMLQANYELTAQNVGEVDYLDKQFYYTGKTNNASEGNVSTTNTKQVVDYVSNLLRYESNYQDVESNWQVRRIENLTNSTTLNASDDVIVDTSKVENDLVNRQYYTNIATYNTLITTDSLSQELLPELFDKNGSSKKTTLVLSTILSDDGEENYVYNNLAEIVATSNKQGRRMSYSISGNQEMSDQSLGNNASEKVYTTVDLVTPSEMDSDSSQRIIILPPLGENKNYVSIILSIIAASLVVAVGIVIIKKRLK